MLKSKGWKFLSVLLFVATGCAMPAPTDLEIEGHEQALAGESELLGGEGRGMSFPWVSADNAGPWNPDEDYGIEANDPCRQIDILAELESGELRQSSFEHRLGSACRPAPGATLGLVIPRRMRPLEIEGRLRVDLDGGVRVDTDLTAARLELDGRAGVFSVDGARLTSDRILLKSSRGDVRMPRLYTRPNEAGSPRSTLRITAYGDVDLSSARMLLANRISIRAGHLLLMERARVMSTGRVYLRSARSDVVLDRANLRGMPLRDSLAPRFVVVARGGDLLMSRGKVNRAELLIYTTHPDAEVSTSPLVQLDRFKSDRREDFCFNGHTLALDDATTWDGAEVQSDRGTRITACSAVPNLAAIEADVALDERAVTEEL